MKQPKKQTSKKWIHVGLIITAFGFFVLLLGADPSTFNLDRSPAVGFVQSATFSFGLAIICMGGYISLKASRKASYEQSLVEDIGLRLIGTGYLVSLVSALADVFGLGTQAWPSLPFLGPSQVAGVVIGEIVIAIGFAMFIPRRDSPH
ncbi:MAG: hypothetical protein MAG431_00271 [Chloroflexi bacterium]|nr:hypothetical protein [Chloroflexota bacterium]